MNEKRKKRGGMRNFNNGEVTEKGGVGLKYGGWAKSAENQD